MMGAGLLALESRSYSMSTDRGMSMTITEFREFLINGGSVEYCLPEQRNELAKFIQDEMGFPIGPGTYEYMVRHPDGRVHYHRRRKVPCV